MENLGNIITNHSEKSPDKWAIKFGDAQYSFLELENLANNIAHFLKEKYKVSKGDRVVIISKKSTELIASIIAIWKLGAIYVPADFNNGINRLKYILDDIKPCLIISSKKYLEEFQSVIQPIPTISYSEIGLLPVAKSEKFHEELDGNEIASIFYTSGSTGRPKGVCLNHKSMTHYFHAENELLKINNESTSINFGPFHFDVCVQDTFIPLYFGASVYILDGLLIPEIITDIIHKNNVTHLICVSSVLSLITPAADEFDSLKSSNLKACMTGGEVCNPALINLWLEKIPGFQIFNGYGPTECNSLCMAYHIKTPDTTRKGPYPIGTCFMGCIAHLIDAHGNVIHEDNVVGTLVIGGKQLMNGYWNLPEETEKAFIIIDNEKYYITGDLSKRDEKGEYSFEGRMDKEVKILGRRINLNEIRNSLLNLPYVEYAFVDAFDVNDRKKIYAYVYGTNLESNIDEHQINGLLRKELPVYMIPERVIISKQIPKTSTNKVYEKEIKKLIVNQIS
ncbi:AMP-binding protein [Kordia sp. YSTF-M3]|uniref:AMP-binding protein n=1 Tax=Kordia aestuariivivens TaxID=2759037 RepID=A0ABR7QE91_9FLAO|nr:AMP-binding protein [Kordia aestuariivivens]MBC8756885.1 AMP-binding protein [Kordia aestuariivivens]